MRCDAMLLNMFDKVVPNDSLKFSSALSSSSGLFEVGAWPA